MPPENRKPIGRPELREHAIPRALSRRRVLDRQQDRAAPFAAEAEPLTEPAERQHDRREQGRSSRRWAADRW